jgi:hypothetical protein
MLADNKLTTEDWNKLCVMRSPKCPNWQKTHLRDMPKGMLGNRETLTRLRAVNGANE